MSKRQRRWIEITADFREVAAARVKAMATEAIAPCDALALSQALINAYWMEQNAATTDANIRRERQRTYFETE